MKKRVHTERGVRYDALAKGYKILKSPLADSFAAVAEHFSEADAPVDEGGGEANQKLKDEVAF